LEEIVDGGIPDSEPRHHVAPGGIGQGREHLGERISRHSLPPSVGSSGSTIKIHLSRLPVGQVIDACTSLLSMTRAERAALPFMHEGAST